MRMRPDKKYNACRVGREWKGEQINALHAAPQWNEILLLLNSQKK